MPVQGATSRYAYAVVTITLLIGCQDTTTKQDRAGRVTVQGKLTNDGQPLQVDGMEVGVGMVQLQFHQLDESGQLADNDPEAETTADANGQFSIPAGGLLPGKYRVAVYQYDPYPSVDKLEGKFNTQNSSIVRDVEGSTELEIDLTSP